MYKYVTMWCNRVQINYILIECKKLDIQVHSTLFNFKDFDKVYSRLNKGVVLGGGFIAFHEENNRLVLISGYDFYNEWNSEIKRYDLKEFVRVAQIYLTTT